MSNSNWKGRFVSDSVTKFIEANKDRLSTRSGNSLEIFTGSLSPEREYSPEELLLEFLNYADSEPSRIVAALLAKPNPDPLDHFDSTVMASAAAYLRDHMKAEQDRRALYGYIHRHEPDPLDELLGPNEESS